MDVYFYFVCLLVNEVECIDGKSLMDVKRLKEYFCRILRSGIGICYKFL